MVHVTPSGAPHGAECRPSEPAGQGWQCCCSAAHGGYTRFTGLPSSVRHADVIGVQGLTHLRTSSVPSIVMSKSPDGV